MSLPYCIFQIIYIIYFRFSVLIRAWEWDPKTDCVDLKENGTYKEWHCLEA